MNDIGPEGLDEERRREIAKEAMFDLHMLMEFADSEIGVTPMWALHPEWDLYRPTTEDLDDMRRRNEESDGT